MLKEIHEVPKIRKSTPFSVCLDVSFEKKIEDYWQDFVKNNQGYWNGDLVSVVSYDDANNILELGLAKYSWVVYSKYHHDFYLHSLFVSILFQTLDSKYVVFRNNHNKLNVLGGVLEPRDLSFDLWQPEIRLKRELLEELNLDLDDKNQVLSYQLKYLKIPSVGRNYGIIYVGKLNFTSNELEDYFLQCKNKLDGEIVELLLSNEEEIKKLEVERDADSYLEELIQLEQRNF